MSICVSLSSARQVAEDVRLPPQTDRSPGVDECLGGMCTTVSGAGDTQRKSDGPEQGPAAHVVHAH
jgi:hypothetical protein